MLVIRDVEAALLIHTLAIAVVPHQVAVVLAVGKLSRAIFFQGSILPILFQWDSREEKTQQTRSYSDLRREALCELTQG